MQGKIDKTLLVHASSDTLGKSAVAPVELDSVAWLRENALSFIEPRKLAPFSERSQPMAKESKSPNRKRKKLEKQRKKKLEEKKSRARQDVSLAYLGMKYKKDELVPTWMETEIGIYEAYVVTDRKLVDQAVASALETLIQGLRRDALAPPAESKEIEYRAGGEEDFVIEMILHRWAAHFAAEWQPPKEKLIGVLRSILGTLHTMRSPGPQSQTYLKYLAGFLTKKLGVSIEMVSEEGESISEPPGDALVQLGQKWHTEGNLEARAEFFELAADLMKSGQAGRVMDACHQLIGEISDSSSQVVTELIDLRFHAEQYQVSAIG